MIYLSAQPDDYYFKWQLSLQILNFKKLGIDVNNIHILIGVDSKYGLRHYFSTFIEENKNNACFFVYEDKRECKNYKSSVRPHIIKQHFEKYSGLEKENIFYHDSDIIFRELPNFRQMEQDDFWYVSDTKNYLDSFYIKNSSGNELFSKMCSGVGIQEKAVMKNAEHTGGAQYLIKNVSAGFWSKVEKDCESLYSLMQKHNYEEAEKLYTTHGIKRSLYKGIQAWCADMWAILWNAWYFNYNVRIHKELDFCWATDPIEQWNQKKILHYSGNLSKDDRTVFNKSIYLKYDPFYDCEINKVNESNCSFPLVELIKEKRSEFDQKRINLKDVTFLIPVRIDSENRLENLYIVLQYLDKFFDTNIIIIESDNKAKVDKNILPASCVYKFIRDDNILLHRTKINNELIRKAQTKIVSLSDTDVIIPIKQITESIRLIRQNTAQMVYPYDGSFVSVDSLFKEMFLKIIDDELLILNQTKFLVGVKRSFGGTVFVNRDDYINAGMENEYFESWGPEDLERWKRMKILGYTIKRTEGNLFHLPHERFINSSYNNTESRIAYMEEYFKICNLRKKELRNYIKTWVWVN